MAVLLAAGRASRFGASKLAANLGGIPLIIHAATTLQRLNLAASIAVVAPGVPDLRELGFDCAPIEPPEAPQSRSLTLGVERAVALGAEQVLIVLADMPFVPLAHFEVLLASANDKGVSTCAGGRLMPPAVFGPGLIPALGNLKGDIGARDLLLGLPTIDLPAELAIDIDTQADLERAECYLAGTG